MAFVYVDDIIFTGSSLTHIQQLITKLKSEFAFKQLGNLDYFLEIKMTHLPNGSLHISQSKYIKGNIKKYILKNILEASIS